MRLVYDNVADIATLSSSNTVATLPVTNLKNDRKSKVGRATGLNWRIEAVLTSAKMVKCAILAFTNLTPTATMRVRGYASSSATTDVTTPTFDVTADLCCPTLVGEVRQDGVGASLGVNQFGQGLHSYALRWFEGASVAKVVIDINDAANPDGYVEAARLLLGNYWEPQYNPDYGLSTSIMDTTKSERDDAGDSHSDRGFRFKKMVMGMTQMQAVDRQRFTDLIRVHGTSKPLFLSVFPADAEGQREQQYMIYGKFSQMSAITAPTYNRYNFPIEIEEV